MEIPFKKKDSQKSENITCAKLQSESPFDGVGVVWTSVNKTNSYLVKSHLLGAKTPTGNITHS